MPTQRRAVDVRPWTTPSALAPSSPSKARKVSDDPTYLWNPLRALDGLLGAFAAVSRLTVPLEDSLKARYALSH